MVGGVCGESSALKKCDLFVDRNVVFLRFVEALSNKIRVIQRMAYGLRDEAYLRLKALTCMLPL